MLYSILRLGGLLSLVLGLGHCAFFRAFGWKEELAKISQRTARVLYTIHLFLIPFFFVFAYIAFFHTAELAGGSPLGLALATFYSAFWLFRGVWQLTYLRLPAQGRIPRFVLIHRSFTVSFFAMSVAFALPVANKLLLP